MIVRRRDLFWTFFKLGLLTFGGGYAMIANIREIVLERKKWLSEEELVQVIAIAESTPGPIAINIATYVGYRKRGFWGSLVATLGVILPSLVIIFLISLFLDEYMHNPWVSGAFVGIKAGVAFLILRAGWDMLKKMDRKILPMTVFFLVFGAMILFELLSVSFSAIVFILAGGGLGVILWGRRQEDKK